MNQKELSELRRRFRPDKNAIGRIYGCYVNVRGEIIADIEEPLEAMPEEEAEKYLNLLKKTMSGAPGKNLIDLVFSTAQVADSEEHRQLMALRESKLRDKELRQAFYRKVIESAEMGDTNYLILLAHDSYDVPARDKNGDRQADDSDRVFCYIVCCVCPVKDGKLELSYCPGENEFHNRVPTQIVAPPEWGFLFPAFDDRAANIYNALAYTRRPEELRPKLLDALFRLEPPMSSPAQKEAFETALKETLENACSLEVVRGVHEQLTGRILEHKAEKDPEPLLVTPREVGGILRDYGVGEEKVSAFCDSCGRQFGEGAALSPANLIDSKRFQVKTGRVTVTVPPESSYLVETRVVDGRRYLLIPVDEDLEVNGLPVDWGAASRTE